MNLGKVICPLCNSEYGAKFERGWYPVQRSAPAGRCNGALHLYLQECSREDDGGQEA